MPLRSTNALTAFAPPSSRAMPITLAADVSATCLRSGISPMHGPHQVAQKLSITGLPSSDSLVTVEPSTDLREKVGTRLPTATASELSRSAWSQPDKIPRRQASDNEARSFMAGLLPGFRSNSDKTGNEKLPLGAHASSRRGNMNSMPSRKDELCNSPIAQPNDDPNCPCDIGRTRLCIRPRGLYRWPS